MAIHEEQIRVSVRDEESRRPAGSLAPQRLSRRRERLWRCVKWVLFLFVFFSVWMGWASIAHA